MEEPIPEEDYDLLEVVEEEEEVSFIEVMIAAREPEPEIKEGGPQLEADAVVEVKDGEPAEATETDADGGAALQTENDLECLTNFQNEDDTLITTIKAKTEPIRVPTASTSDEEYNSECAYISSGPLYWAKPDDVRDQIRYRSHCKQNNTIPSGYFQRHMHDEFVNMAHCSLGVKGLIPVLIGLEENNDIIVLDLSDNDLGEEGMTKVIQLLSTARIPKVVLRYNQMSVANLVDLCTVIADQSYPTSVDISDNLLGHRGGLVLIDALPRISCIKSLILSNIGLGEANGTKLANAFATSVTLKVLDLSYNVFKGNEAINFLKNIKKNRSITHLDLSFNGFGNRCTPELVLLIRKMPSLEHLNMTQNNITFESCDAIGKAIKGAKTLVHFDISMNSLTHNGAMILLESLYNEITSVEELIMKFQYVEKPFVELLKEVCELRNEVYVRYAGMYGEYTLKNPKPLHKLKGEEAKAEKAKLLLKDPFIVLREMVEKRGVDLEKAFFPYDFKQTKFIHPDNIKAACKEYGIPLREASYRLIQETLAPKDAKGRYDYTALIIPINEVTPYLENRRLEQEREKERIDLENRLKRRLKKQIDSLDNLDE